MHTTIKTPKFNPDAVSKTSVNFSANSTRSKVLFVDDEERVLNALKALFRGKYDIATTTDGYEALRLLQEHNFDLIVSDQRMPIMKGVDLLREAKRVAPNTVRVLLTGFSDLADLVGTVNDGEIFRFISKPWDNDEMTEIVGEGVNIGIALAAEAYEMQMAGKSPYVVVEEEQAETVVRAEKKGDGVIVINGDQSMLSLVEGVLPLCPVYLVASHEEALYIMSKHEIAIVVSSMDGDHREDAAFFAALKREHPQITSIIIGPSGDSEAIVSLINNARVFRYMFKPLKFNLLDTYLNSAFREHIRVKESPALQLQQKPKAASDLPEVSPKLISAMKSLKGIFRARSASTIQ